MTSADSTPQRAPRSATRQGRPNYTLRRIGALGVVILLALIGYALAVGLAPLPQLRPVLSGAAEQRIELDGAGAETAVRDQDLPTAIGWASPTRAGADSGADSGADGPIWTNDERAYPIASITKLVTVLVGLEKQPLAPGENGPMYTYSEADRAREAELRRLDAIMHPVPVGSRFSTRELFELMLLPSSNDYAIAYADWVFGDNAGYRAAVADWAKRHGLDSLRVVEPSGLDEGNVASAADLVRLGRIALQHPVVLEITRMRAATIPGIGKVTSTNPLLGSVKGVTGLKTGSLDAAGFNLLASQTVRVKGRELVQLSATLARPTREVRAASGRETLAEMAALPKRKRIVAEGEHLGSVTTWQGERVELVAAAEARAVLVPGESATRTAEVSGIAAAPMGTRVGEIRITAPVDTPSVAVITAAPIVQPGLWWRVTHPARVFGWG